jgi:hypothetical protein
MFLAHLMLQGLPEAIPVNPIARWVWVFPVVESIHICGFTLLVGTVTLLDLRLAGLCFRQQTVSQVAKNLDPWTNAGVLIQLITGLYLFSGDPGEYVQVEAFRSKMLLLVLALIFHFTVIRRATVAALDSSALGWRRPAALVSLGLWVSVLVCGLWIGNL